MAEELKTISVLARDHDRYMAFCEVYNCFTTEEFLGVLLDWVNIPDSAEEILRKKTRRDE